MGVREEYMCVRGECMCVRGECMYVSKYSGKGNKYSGKGRQLIYVGCDWLFRRDWVGLLCERTPFFLSHAMA